MLADWELKYPGRTESIFMSLPPVVRWPYDYRPEPDSREALRDLYGLQWEERDWPGLIASANRLVELEPKSAGMLATRAMALIRSG